MERKDTWVVKPEDERPARPDVHFEYLDDLRDSGAINMYAAVPYIVEKFGLSMSEATDVLVQWVESYSDRHYY